MDESQVFSDALRHVLECCWTGGKLDVRYSTYLRAVVIIFRKKRVVCMQQCP